MSEMKNMILEEIRNDLEETFQVIEDAQDPLDVSLHEVETAKQIALGVYRMYTQVAAAGDTLLPGWPTEGGHILATTSARFAAYNYLVVVTSNETDSIDRLIEDADGVMSEALVGGGEEE